MRFIIKRVKYACIGRIKRRFIPILLWGKRRFIPILLWGGCSVLSGAVSATCNTGSIPLTTEAGVRFILHAATAFDTKTGLTWLRCSAGAYWDANAGCVGDVKIMSLTQAELYAANTGTDWRVPTIQELYSIVDINCTNPAIRSDIFPDIKSLSEGSPYWSDSEVEGLPSLFYYVDFIDGSVDGHSNGFPLAVRLVRSGQ